MPAEYVIGIDLGTTNSVLAYASLDAEEPRIELLPIPQLVAAGTVESHTTLPSFLYLASEHEAESGAYDLPWATGRDFVVGRLARDQAAEFPDRTVGAAKSWLCHSRVDRHTAILPWGAADDVPKISPVTASQRYLEHLIDAWEQQFPEAPVTEQSVVLTVPASFDASARELTREAALAAGLPDNLVLLEEPQSAVYCWLNETGDRWRKLLKAGDHLLVCDIGGGTTDLSLITVVDEEGDLVLKRLAVGDHLLVGGDNMDLSLAHHAATLFAGEGPEPRPLAIRVAVAFLPGRQGNFDGPQRPRSTHHLGPGPREPIDRRHGLGRSPKTSGPKTVDGRLLPVLRSQRSAGPAAGVGLSGNRTAV